MPSNSAEYMREYRKRKRYIETPPPSAVISAVVSGLDDLRAENSRLTEEVTCLKRIIAQQFVAGKSTRNPYAEFRPAPKSGKWRHLASLR